MSTDPASLAAGACNVPASSIPFTQLVKNNLGFLESLGLNHCVTDSLNTSQSESVSINAFIESGSRSESSSYALKTTNGCSAINALLQTYNNAINDVQCIIKESTTNLSLTNDNINSIVFTAKGNINVDCPSGFSITQTIGTKVELINKIDAATTSKIQESVVNHINSFTNQLQNMYKGHDLYGPDGQGTQVVNNIFSNNTQNQIKNQVADTITNLVTAVESQNSLSLSAGGNIFIQGDQCKISQGILSQIYSNSIVSDAFVSAFSAQDLQSIIPPLPYTPPPPPSSTTTSYVMYIVIILALVLLACGYYFIKKRK